MKQTLGFYMQFAALVFLPALLLFSINVGFKKLLVMPVLTAAAAGLFWVGHRLRESR